MTNAHQQMDLSLPEKASPEFIERLLSTLKVEIQNARVVAAWQLPAYEYLLSSYTTKYVDEGTTPAQERRHRAIVKWLAVEDHNKRTNRRISEESTQFRLCHKKQKAWTKSFSSENLLSYARWYIRGVLGSSPPDGLVHMGSFTGGASTSVKRQPGSQGVKFTDGLDVTVSAFHRCVTIPSESEPWSFALSELARRSIQLKRGNVLFTVPKTAEIDRVAAKEPSLNMWAQRACGDFIRRKLREVGIDLNDQRPNGWAAGKRQNQVATIDLSSASDSLSKGLVEELLPPEWFSLLNALRSHYTFVDGEWHLNEMFSSMGNGFTFELETLVFWALARATAHILGRDIHGIEAITPQHYEYSATNMKVTTTGLTCLVYGDDIVIDREVAGPLIQVLRWCGFIVNTKKSHWHANDPIRESCGRHYYQSREVTPFYVRGPIRTVPDMILQLNLLRAWIIQVGADVPNQFGRTPFVSIWKSMAEKYVPRQLWGGYDTAVRTQLAAPVPPQLEIVEVRKPLKRRTETLGRGLYLASLRQLELKSGEAGDNTPRELSEGSDLDPMCIAAPEESLISPDQSPLHQTVGFRGSSDRSLETNQVPSVFVASAPYLLPPKGKLAVRKTKWRPAVFGLYCPLFLSEQR